MRILVLLLSLLVAQPLLAKSDVVSDVPILGNTWRLLTFDNGDQKKVHNIVYSLKHNETFHDSVFYYKFVDQPWQWVTFTWYYVPNSFDEDVLQKDLFDWKDRDWVYTIDDKYPNVYYVLKVGKVNYFCKTFTRNEDGTTCFTTALYSHNTYDNIKINLEKDMQVVDMSKKLGKQ